MIETRIDSLDFLAQLADEVIFDYTATADSITTIVTALLALQEHGTPITIGTIEPTDTLTFTIKQDTILNILIMVQETVGGYISVNNDRELDWLDDIGEDKGQQIRYKKNIKGLSRTREYTNFGNKLYCYGAGEGDARVHLSDSDAIAVDYVEDGASQGTYGICIKQLVDKSITDANALYAWAVLRLAEMKVPRTSYMVDMVNLAAMGWDFEALQLGSIVDIIDEDMGIDISARIVRITRDLSDPKNIQIEISNIGKDIIDITGGTYYSQEFQKRTSPIMGGDQIVAGILSSVNWAAGAGSQFNLNDGTFKLGGSTAPKLSWDGTTLKIVGTLQATNIEAGKTLTVNGSISAGGGAIILDSTALSVYGQLLKFYSGVTYVGVAGAFSTTAMYMGAAAAGISLSLLSGGSIYAGRSILAASTTYDIGDATYYFDDINYKDLIDRGCARPVFPSYSDVIRGIRTTKRIVTLQEAEAEGMGKTTIERIKKHGEEIEELDLNSFPEEMLRIPTQEDYDKAERRYQEVLKYTGEGKETLLPAKRLTPKVGRSLEDMVYVILRSHQEALDRLDRLEGT